MVTIKDISKICGVSPATVSKALNGHSDIGMETAKHIRDVARELEYLPNATARALKTNRSYNIGVLFVDKTSSGLTHEFFSLVLNSLKVEAESLGYDITFINKNIGKLEMDYYEHSKYRACDGVIIASVDFHDPDVIKLVNSEIVTVTIDHVFNNTTAVMSDNVGGIESLVNYVIKKGHKKIAFIHGENTSVTQKRLGSFYKTCKEAGINVPDEYVVSAIYHDPGASAVATQKLMSLSDRPTCILYPDDYSYIGGMNALESMGLSIPNDVSVAGYDGIYLSQELRPRLTTWKQNSEAMGRYAAKSLIDAIENPKSFFPQQILVPGQLLAGETIKDLTNGKV